MSRLHVLPPTAVRLHLVYFVSKFTQCTIQNTCVIVSLNDMTNPIRAKVSRGQRIVQFYGVTVIPCLADNTLRIPKKLHVRRGIFTAAERPTSRDRLKEDVRHAE